MGDSIKSRWHYAWEGSGPRWLEAGLGVVGGSVGGLVFWVLGVKLPQEILDNPSLSGVLATAVAGVAGVTVAFIGRFCWWPIYCRFHPYGGLVPYLRAKLGIQMWPIILMAAGFFCFVALSGCGLVWFVVQNLSGGAPVGAVNAAPAVSSAPPFQMSDNDRARLELLARTKALPQKDKEDLSILLRTISQLFNDADAIRSDAATLVQDFYNQRGRSGTIVRNLNANLAKLQTMTEAAAIVQKKMAPYSQGQYFDRQVNFMFEGSPNELQQLSYETESLSQFMQKWATIQNKNDPDIEALLEPSIKKFSTGFEKVYGWMANCRVRLGQIKEQIL
jgi:hypothetical protein